jgi:hypothetical protein
LEPRNCLGIELEASIPLLHTAAGLPEWDRL